MSPGDLVRMKEHVQPPHLYGPGLVLEVKSMGASYFFDRIKVKWTKLPHKKAGWMSSHSVWRINENR